MPLAQRSAVLPSLPGAPSFGAMSHFILLLFPHVRAAACIALGRRTFNIGIIAAAVAGFGLGALLYGERAGCGISVRVVGTCAAPPLGSVCWRVLPSSHACCPAWPWP